MKKGVCILFVMLTLAHLAGCGNSEESREKIDYGIEVRTDINGDGKTDRVRVVDTVNGDYAFTQVCAAINEGDNFFIDYSDSWASSYLVTGDLSGNGTDDVIVIRYYTGSTYDGCAVSVLHMGKNDLGQADFVEYSSVFLENPELTIEQPVGFGEEDGFSCVGASIIEKNGKTMLRLIACVDSLNDIVQCVDCSYRADGWYIEDIQTVSGYWENDRKSELLGYSYSKNLENPDAVSYESDLDEHGQSADDVSETQYDVETIFVNRHGDVFHSEGDTAGVMVTLKAFEWLVPRSSGECIAENLSAEENEYIIESNQVLNGFEEAEDHVWIRLVQSLVPTAEDTTIPHKDFIFYVVGEDAFVGIQSPEDNNSWAVWKMPDYGDWLEKEINIYIRMTTGL